MQKFLDHIWYKNHRSQDEFAQFLGTLFTGGVDVPLPFPMLIANPRGQWRICGMPCVRMKANRCDDDAGLVAELVQFSPNHCSARIVVFIQ